MAPTKWLNESATISSTTTPSNPSNRSNPSNKISEQRLDYNLLSPKYWFKFRADESKTGKRCFFKDAVAPKPRYLLGNFVGQSNNPTNYVVAKGIRTMADLCDVPGRVKNKIDFGETSPLILVGPSKGSANNKKINTFENLFGGFMELDQNQSESLKENPPISRPLMRRTLENSQTKARVFLRESGDEPSENKPLRLGLKIVHDNKNRFESDYWTTTFRCQKVESSTILESPNTHDSRDSDFETSTKITASSSSGQLEFLGNKSNPDGKCSSENLSVTSECKKGDHVTSKAGRLLKQFLDAKKETQPVPLPLFLQGLKRSENGWYRKVKSGHIL